MTPSRVLRPAFLLLCGLSLVSAVREVGPTPAWEVCEVYKPTECADHPDTCSLCTGPGGHQLCFDPSIASKLPDFLFDCTATKTPSGKPSAWSAGRRGGVVALVAEREDTTTDPTPPWEVCEVFNATECAGHSDTCSLCTGPDGRQLCFDAAIAAKLPPFIFKCSATAPLELEAPAPTPPWEVCEVFNATECAGHSDTCSLCTGPDGRQLCFDAAIAAKLPPFIFKCTGVPSLESDLAGAAPAPAPEPWVPCESYNATECTTNKDKCALCEMLSGESMCFNPTVAEKLPPFIFKCKLPSLESDLAIQMGAAPGPAPEPWVPCESYNATVCKTKEDKCSLCEMPGKSGKPKCFSFKVAEKLPPAFFNCTLPELPSDGPECSSNEDQAQCAGTSGCAWCTSASLPSGCFGEEDATHLPLDSFHCQTSSSVA